MINLSVKDTSKLKPEEMTQGQLLMEVRRLRDMINTPHTQMFLQAVNIEAVHQREHRGADDQLKTPFDWFWTCGYLCQKAAHAAVDGDREKALHHTISTAALMANWHRQIQEG